MENKLKNMENLIIQSRSINSDEYKIRGEDYTIHYGYHMTHFGKCLLAVCDGDICHLSFIYEEKKRVEELKNQWYKSKLIEDSRYIKSLIKKIYDKQNTQVKLLLKGTDFQIKVWEALLKIPYGTTASYKDIAIMINKSSASRAVGRVIGQNSIGYLIPCHRVIKQNGKMSGYRWGMDRKKAILEWEATHTKEATFFR